MAKGEVSRALPLYPDGPLRGVSAVEPNPGDASLREAEPRLHGARVATPRSDGDRGLIRRLPMLAGSFLDVRRARARVSAPKTLRLLYVETTLRCNASCGMCGYPSDYPEGKQPLSFSELEALVQDAKDLGVWVMSLGGGEPFLRPDCEDLIKRISEAGIVPFVHSNGSLLNHARCERLAENRHMVLALSLDSHRREVHDSIRRLRCFDALTSAARYFATTAPNVDVVFTFAITGVNYRDMLPVLHLARDIGVETVRFTPFHENLQHRFKPKAELKPFRIPNEAIPEIADNIEEVLRFCRAAGMTTNSPRYLRAIPSYLGAPVPHDCYAGFLFASVDPFGNLMPCYDHIGQVNIRDMGGLGDAFRSPEMNELRQRVVDCQHQCWNVGNAEPSLRLDPNTVFDSPSQLLREASLFLS